MPAPKKLRVFSFPLPLILFIVLLVVTAVYFFSLQDVSFSTIFKSVPTPTPISSNSRKYTADVVTLPVPAKTGRMSVEQSLWARRSRRSFLDKPISLKQLSQLIWSLQGVTVDWGGRTTPSAKSAYPLELYVIALKVDDLAPGIYHYIPGDRNPAHQLGPVKLGDFSEEALAAAQESSTTNAPVVFVLSGNMARMAKFFNGQRMDNNVYLEAGHAAQNLYLEVESLGLGTVATGGFDPKLSATLINLPTDETLIYWMPVGYSKE